MKKILFYLLFVLTIQAQAQRNTIFSSQIKTLQLIVNQDWSAPPIVGLNTADQLEISFDELSHDYHAYRYILTHCDTNWQTSNLAESDYLSGFNDNEIESQESSINTSVLYTHYKVTLPNETVSFTISGNYKVTVYDEEEGDKDTPVFEAFFSVISPKVSIATTVSCNTLIDTNSTHQEVSFTINHKDYPISSPQSSIKVQVFQNRRWDNAVLTLQPTAIMNNQLRYEHNRQLIFDANNEYRRFEVVNLQIPLQGVEKINYFDPYYHTTLYTDKERRNYSYDRDQNGLRLIRYDQASDDAIEADYTFVHFTLASDEPLIDKTVYLQGAFTYDRFNKANRMKYNGTLRQYENTQLLKLGAYNYQYLTISGNNKKGSATPFENNFYETENEYLILVYDRPFGSRYDHLIGMQRISYAPNH